jgi:hypothetical protein
MPSCCGQGRGLSSRCSRSSNLMYLCGKAIHVSRRAGKASKQLLGTPPGGYRRNVVEVQQHTTFPVDSRLSGVFQIAKWDSVPTSWLVGSDLRACHRFWSDYGQTGNYQSCHAHHAIWEECLDTTFSNLQCGIQIRMVAGFGEVIEREETLVAGTSNHPNCWVLRFSFPMVRVAA